MLGPPKARRLDRLVLASLDQLVPQDHFYRRLEAKLDLQFVREWVGEKYAERGRPSIDPVVFFKLQLIRFFEGLRSERKLIETASLHLAHRWYVGYALDEPLPHHSSLTRIRTRLGIEVFQRFFERVVELCQEAGLVWGKELFFDGTNVRANADIDSLTPRFAQQAQDHLAALFAADGMNAPDDAAAGPLLNEPSTSSGNDDPPGRTAGAGRPPTPLPCADTRTAKQLAAQNEAQWKLLDERRLDPSRPPSGSYRRMTDFRVSATDPDATPMSKGEAATLGYHDHSVVDGGTARIILAALVTPADVQDNQAFLDLLDHVCFRYHLHVRRAVADSKYATGENLRALAERRIHASMPVVDHEQATPFFRHTAFVYEPETDSYHCPQGATLRYRGNSYRTRSRVSNAPASVCGTCPLRERCTTSREGRKLSRSFDEDYRELARQQQTTEAYKQALRKRQVWVEPLFGEAKEWHHLRRFRLRGLNKVNMEGLLVAAGQNLKRWLQAVGRDRGPATRHSVSALRFAPWLPQPLCGSRP